MAAGKSGMLSNMRIGTRLFLLLGFLIIIPVILGFLGYRGIQETDDALENVYKRRMIPVTYLADMDDGLMSVMIEIYLAQKHDPEVPESVLHEKTHHVDKHIKAIRENWQQAVDSWGKFKSSEGREKEKVFIEKVDQRMEEFRVQALEPIVKDLEGGTYSQAYELAAYRLGGIFGNLEKDYENLIEENSKTARENMDQADEDNSKIELIMVIGTLIGIVVSIIFGLIILRSITRPLAEMVQRVGDIAQGEGDLTRRVEVSSNDELGDMAIRLNQFIEKIHDIVVNIASTTRDVLTASEKLNESSQSLSASTEQTSTQSESISSSTTQLSQNMQVVSSSVEEMSISVQEVAKKAAEAASVAGDAQTAASESNQTVTRLGNDASEIGSVIESIVSIAEQTNLLALNASIEAAGAGEAGKGFAVVASEVKELARQAGVASEEIKTKITGMQQSTEKTVDSIQRISDIINHVNDISSNIASAVEEQSITAREIANNIGQATVATNDVTKNISGISDASVQGAREAANALDLAKELQRHAMSLNQIVDQFKIAEEKRAGEFRK